MGAPISFGGHDLGELCSAEVVSRATPCVSPTGAEVPGRAGLALVAGHVEPTAVTVRLTLDMGYDPGAAGLAEARARLRAWLALPEGGELVLPGEPGLTWRDAVVTGCGEWSDASEHASCEVEFTLLDPVAYGRAREEAGTEFSVGGTWPTWPVFTLVAEEGDALCVADAASGACILVEHAFSGGEAVEIDCESEAVTVDGEDAEAEVALGSDFFSLAPGDVILSTSGAASCTTAFTERWL